MIQRQCKLSLSTLRSIERLYTIYVILMVLKLLFLVKYQFILLSENKLWCLVQTLSLMMQFNRLKGILKITD